MIYYARGSAHESISDSELAESLSQAFSALGKRRRVLVVPPDFTRFHSRAGRITELAWVYYGSALTDVLPVTGTHFEVTAEEKRIMFGRVPGELFRVHRWREDLETLGRVPADYVRTVSEGAVSFDWPAQVDRLIAAGWPRPHPLHRAGRSPRGHRHGGPREEYLHRRRRGGSNQQEPLPGRRIRNGADDGPGGHAGPCGAGLGCRDFISPLPIVHVLTVVGRDADGSLALKGLFVGDDREVFTRAASLAQEVNIQLVEEPLAKVIVYLDPGEFKSTWLGNKSIYRTRMAIADGGELIVLAPGVRRFGEDPGIDALIRKYGYFTTPRILQLVGQNVDLQQNLSVAAHLIHGSSEERFSITYCPSGLTQEEVEKAGFRGR